MLTVAGMLEVSNFILMLLDGALTNGHWSCCYERYLGSACVGAKEPGCKL
jgi:hypothetical protein